MSIVFGWNSFKIRGFSLKELGIEQNAESNIRIEAHQRYFHLFWIPFFSLGKKWVVRRGNQLYEMPGDLETLVKRSPKTAGIRTPFYTYAGPLLIIIGLFIYWANEQYSQYKSKQWTINTFNAEKAVLESKLQHLTTRDFISVLRLDSVGMDTTIYLKIEDIKGDEMTVTPVKLTRPTQGYRARAWEVEDEYTRNADILPSAKISYKQLQSAYVKEYISPSDREALKRQSTDLLHDGRRYVTTAVVRHFGPILSRRGTGGYGGSQLFFDLDNEGWPATVSDIKELTGNGDWSGNINKKVPARELSLFGPTFTLDGVNCIIGKPYKIIMTLRDTTGQLHKYEIEGVELDQTVKEL